MVGNLVVIAALMAGALSVTLQDATPQAVPQPQATSQPEIIVKGEVAKRDRKVCKRATPTGSLMVKVTCRTAGEWEQIREADLAALERVQQEKRGREMVQIERGKY